MTPDESAESTPVSVSRRGNERPGSDPLRTVVWVRGEQDAATRKHLSGTIARAADLDDADLIVDLSGVTFMDASTIGALVVARNRLRVLSRSLCLRNPSPRARRLLEVCRLERLIDELAVPPPAAAALGSWVGVPARNRGLDSAQPPPVAHRAPYAEPACVMAQGRVEPAGSNLQRRAPS